MPKAKPAKAYGIAADIAAMKAIGMSDEAIQAQLAGAPKWALTGEPTVTQQVPTVPAQTAHQRQDSNLGPDPAVVARHQAAVANMPKAVLEETFEVTLERRYVDYVRNYAAFISAKRPNSPPITMPKAIELIVRAYKVVDPDRPIWEGARGGTGPKALPPAEWAQKTA